MIEARVLKHLLDTRNKGAKKMTREERQSEKQCKRVGVQGSLKEKWLEEMTQSNTFSPQGQK